MHHFVIFLQSNISRADLNEALATGSYDYISSTYCLLAEKQLRRRLQKAPKVTTPNVQKNDKARRASERDCVTPPRAVNGSRMSMTGDVRSRCMRAVLDYGCIC